MLNVFIEGIPGSGKSILLLNELLHKRCIEVESKNYQLEDIIDKIRNHA